MPWAAPGSTTTRRAPRCGRLPSGSWPKAGPDALTVRAVAEEVGTTTRAIYSVFGSKDGLVETLAEAAFEYLGNGLDEMPETDDPAADLVECGAVMYRRFVREHPSLFRIAFQRIVPALVLGEGLLEARARSWEKLEGKVRRLKDAGQLGELDVTEAAVTFNALCEGLANAELRGGTMRAAPGRPGGAGLARRLHGARPRVPRQARPPRRARGPARAAPRACPTSTRRRSRSARARYSVNGRTSTPASRRSAWPRSTPNSVRTSK